MKILVTGVAGFIGYFTAKALLAQGHTVIGIDAINAYYDVTLKHARLAQLAGSPRYHFHQLDIADKEAVDTILSAHADITDIIHLAAQAGVRYSMVNPYAYVQSNVMGHLVMLEAARRLKQLHHFVYASSSSVYGLNSTLPFAESARVDTPSSLYAATKRADELISHAYGHLYHLPQTGLRFFTVYGPWGRPDMAYYMFAEAIMAGRPISLYEGGTLQRDFTYIDDIVDGILGVLNHPPPPGTPRLLNIGNNRSERVSDLVRLLEESLGRTALIQTTPRPAADIERTWASVDAIAALTGYAPTTSLAVGIPKFVDWLVKFKKDAPA